MLTAARLGRQDEEYERRLRGLQQEYEKVKLELGQAAAKAEGAARSRGRAKELEGLVEQLRSSHSKKVKALEQQLRVGCGGWGGGKGCWELGSWRDVQEQVEAKAM